MAEGRVDQMYRGGLHAWIAAINGGFAGEQNPWTLTLSAVCAEVKP